MPRRADLAEFLRVRRRALDPAALGLPPGRRRTAGIRREELAMLAGVSVSWYTWLEQGRPINASTDVLDALARTLRQRPDLMAARGPLTADEVQLLAEHGEARLLRDHGYDW